MSQVSYCTMYETQHMQVLHVESASTFMAHHVRNRNLKAFGDGTIYCCYLLTSIPVVSKPRPAESFLWPTHLFSVKLFKLLNHHGRVFIYNLPL